MLELSIVVPFYNEQDNAENVVRSLQRELGGIDYELLLVDNGSRDGTNAILQRLCRANRRCRLVVVHKNEGYGNGIVAGFAAATGQFVGWTYGDGQVPAADVRRVFKALKESSAELGKATRVKRGDGLVRKIESVVFNGLFGLLFGVRTADVNGCPKVMKASVLKAIAPTAKDWWIDSQIMIGAAKKGFKVVEVPIESMPRTSGASKVRLTTALEFLGHMLKEKVG